MNMQTKCFLRKSLVAIYLYSISSLVYAADGSALRDYVAELLRILNNYVIPPLCILGVIGVGFAMTRNVGLSLSVAVRILIGIFIVASAGWIGDQVFSVSI